MRVHDVSMRLDERTIVYPGNPELRIAAQQAIAQGSGANISSIQLGSHTGTHVDAPRHFLDGGVPVDELPLDVLIGPARVVEFDGKMRSISRADLKRADVDGDAQRLLFKTRNSSLLHGEEFVRDFTYLEPDGAEYLVARGVRLVGVDYLSIEQFRSGHHRTHLTLLTAGVVIVEGLDLSRVQPGDYELVCLPLRFTGLDGAPARAVLIERL